MNKKPVRARGEIHWIHGFKNFPPSADFGSPGQSFIIQIIDFEQIWNGVTGNICHGERCRHDSLIITIIQLRFCERSVPIVDKQ